MIIYRVYQKGSEIAIQASNQLFDQLRGKVTERINRLYEPVLGLVELAVTLEEVARPVAPAGLQHPLLHFLVTALDRHPHLYALYLGFENGDFFEVARIDDKPEMQKNLGAPPQSHYGVMTITHDALGVPRQVWTFLDRQQVPLLERPVEKVVYDPRSRPWYRLGMGSDTVVRTDPYVFAQLGQPGITFAHRFTGKSTGVFGADISLATLSQFLSEQQFTPSSTILFFDSSGTVTGYPRMEQIIKNVQNLEDGSSRPTFATVMDLDRPDLIALFQLFKQGGSTDVVTFDVAGRPHIGAVARTPITPNGNTLLGIVAPLDEFLGPIYHIGRENMLSSLLVMLVMLPIIWWVSWRIARPLGELTAEIAKVQRMQLDTVGDVSTHILEIYHLFHAFQEMTLSLKEYKQRLGHTQGQLRLLVETGIALAKERHFNKLLETILLNGKAVGRADGGTLYLVGEDGQLHFKIVRNDSLGLMLGGEGGEPIHLPPLSLERSADGLPRRSHVATFVVQSGQTLRIDDAYALGADDFPGTLEMDRKTGYRSVSLLTVPIKTQRGEVLGVLQLLNALDPLSNAVVTFTEDTVGFVEALAAQAATALENQNLIDAQKRLFNAFIQMLASAIDTKSPYTGGHCARVPVLAQWLSEAAEASAEGLFAGFQMSEDDRYALHLASWLHDCGKVATPEYIVDKATKLETIYNRIHEIRMRFEVLHRDAEIRYWQDRLAEGADAASLWQRFEADVATLADEFAFIAACNVGSEFLDDQKKARIRTIAERRWMRRFDDRLGLSHSELNRFGDKPPAPLPAAECVLADKEEQRIQRVARSAFSEPSQEAFRVEIPELYQNTGEIYNLCVERGTLTPEDRYLITEHIMLTIRMLEKLPLPRALRHVPEYAGAHHETMNGTGYPRKLTRAQMSVPARIMAIADIFEALTASDRPYKKAKPLSEAIRIMGYMARDQQIDADLFQLFLQHKVHLRYAERFLAPEQRDISE
ncbi:MAG: GAF domain-containing protein [Magnetococcales bacterium]|nr:GAF domain-containing protein [Magnetococcales bacterium]